MNLVVSTDLGTYELTLSSREKGEAELNFSQSSRGNISKSLLLQDWEHKIVDRNKEVLKRLRNEYQEKMEEVIGDFHLKMRTLEGSLAKELEALI